MKDKNLEYIEHTNIDEMKTLGWEEAPMIIIDGEEYTFIEAVKWINSLEE